MTIIERAILAQYVFNNKIKKFRCLICSETFVNEDEVFTHVKNKHQRIVREDALIMTARD